MGITRRDWVGLGLGVAAGGAVSPVPWKLLDDSTIWTQNWPWTPTPVRAVLSEKTAICTLCQAGCGMRARCAGTAVVGLAPVASNPAGDGALCPVVYGAHQLAYHPQRLRKGMVKGREVMAAEAVHAAAEALKAARRRNGLVAFLDERPGRILSAMYSQLAAQTGGQVVTIPQAEDRTLAATEALSGEPSRTLGFDFENSGVIVGLGAPLLDGWGGASRLPGLWARRTAKKPWFVQVGSRWSRSAQLADVALLIRPGSEAALLSALAGEVSFEKAATVTGLAATDIEKLARLMDENGPAVVVGGGEAASGGLSVEAERLVAGVNQKFGSLGHAGGVMQRRREPMAAPTPGSLEQIADGSLAVLIHDASSAGVVVPEAQVRRKLAPGGVLVRLTAYRSQGDGAVEIVVPATGFLESADDSAGSRDARQASWRYSAAVVAAPQGVLSPQAFVEALASELGVTVEAYETLRKAKLDAIAKSGRGLIYGYKDGASAPVPKAEEFAKRMDEGAVWVDTAETARALTLRAEQFDWSAREVAAGDLMLMAVGWRGSMGTAPDVPLSGKLGRETRLLPVADEVRMAPKTAHAMNLREGETVTLVTAAGEIEGRLKLDGRVAPGLVEVTAAGEARQTVLDAARTGGPGGGGLATVQVRRA